MTDVAAFANFCGPGAYAAIAGVTREEAARELSRWMVRAGWLPGTYRASGTAPNVLAGALLSRGFRLERWSTLPGGWREESADECARTVFADLRRDRALVDELAAGIGAVNEQYASAADRIRAELPAAAVRLFEASVAAARAKAAERRRAAALQHLTVGAWLVRFRRGVWLQLIDGHFLVQSAGRIIAGDDYRAYACASAELLAVWRVLPAGG